MSLSSAASHSYSDLTQACVMAKTFLMQGGQTGLKRQLSSALMIASSVHEMPDSSSHTMDTG